MNVPPADPSEIFDRIQKDVGANTLVVQSPKGNSHTILITPEGYIIGSYSDLRKISSGTNIDNFMDSCVYKSWLKSVEGLEGPQILKIGRREEEMFSSKTAQISDLPRDISARGISLSSHRKRNNTDPQIASLSQASAHQIIHDPRQYPQDHFRYKPLHVHHIMEKNIFQKLQMELRSSFFSIDKSMCVLLSPEFHQRYMHFNPSERNSFTVGMDSEEAKKKSSLLCDSVYRDRSLSPIRQISSIIINSAFSSPPSAET